MSTFLIILKGCLALILILASVYYFCKAGILGEQGNYIEAQLYMLYAILLAIWSHD